tara:strand:- start:321 stop:743 length:423 start_codon:yes stop_codon:yes gene_type:complete
MKKLLIILFLAPLISTGQSLRYEVYNKISQVFEVVENSALIIKTSNLNTEKSMINKGIVPLTISIYRFKKEGNNAPLYTVADTHYSLNRRVISMRSNEQNPSRQDYQPFWLSQVRTITYGPVRKNSEGFFYTTETSFNLE